MGGIFLRRQTRHRAEVISDRGRDIANLLRILPRHYPQFLGMLRFQLTTRAEFERLTRVDPVTLTDLERAARFLYLQRTAFGGKVSSRNFGVSKDRPGRFNLTTLEPMLEDRLSGVVIECPDYSDFILRYDGAGTLLYLNPPYRRCADDPGQLVPMRSDPWPGSYGYNSDQVSQACLSDADNLASTTGSGPMMMVSPEADIKVG